MKTQVASRRASRMEGTFPTAHHDNEGRQTTCIPFHTEQSLRSKEGGVLRGYVGCTEQVRGLEPKVTSDGRY